MREVSIQSDCELLQCVAVCCSVLQCVAVCCSVLQCVAVCYSALQCVAEWSICARTCNFRSDAHFVVRGIQYNRISYFDAIGGDSLWVISWYSKVWHDHISYHIILPLFAGICFLEHIIPPKCIKIWYDIIWHNTRWPRPIKCLNLQVIFRQRANNCRALLWKMTCKDKACYGSSPPCTLYTTYVVSYQRERHNGIDWFNQMEDQRWSPSHLLLLKGSVRAPILLMCEDIFVLCHLACM